MYFIELPNELMYRIMTNLDIRKDDIAIFRSLNKYTFNISNHKISCITYPWNKNESFTGLTLSYHTHMIYRNRLLEISKTMEYTDEEIDNEILEYM